MRRTAPLAGALLAVLISGCQPATEPHEFQPSSFVGSSVSQLEGALPAATTFVVYDVSLPVAAQTARYGRPGAGTNDDWLIVVACGTVESFAVGVVNGEDYTPEVAEAARQGEYDELLAECKAA